MNLVDVYNRNAAYWDSTLYRGAYHGAYVRLFRSLNRSGRLARSRRVLDCGIGAGLLSESLFDSGVRPLEIHGVDLSPRLLEMARSKLNSLGANARLAFGDISKLPYRDNAMDVVLSALVLEHVPDPAVAVREMARVLRRPGLLVVVATRSGAPDHFFRWKYRYRPYPAKAVLNWMTEAGLVEVGPYELAGVARLFARAYVGVKPENARQEWHQPNRCCD